MTVEYGLLMSVLGISITLIGFFIAYLHRKGKSN